MVCIPHRKNGHVFSGDSPRENAGFLIPQTPCSLKKCHAKLLANIHGAVQGDGVGRRCKPAAVSYKPGSWDSFKKPHYEHF